MIAKCHLLPAINKVNHIHMQHNAVAIDNNHFITTDFSVNKNDINHIEPETRF